MDDEEQTYLLDHAPANLLPYSKQMIPDDPEAVMLPKMYQPSNPAAPADLLSRLGAGPAICSGPV